jgi:hypothetical protein
MSEPQSEPRKAPVIPADRKAFNARLIAEFRANRGQFSGDMAGRSILILTTIGARSGELAKAVPYLGQQQSLTKREIPIVVFERL